MLDRPSSIFVSLPTLADLPPDELRAALRCICADAGMTAAALARAAGVAPYNVHRFFRGVTQKMEARLAVVAAAEAMRIGAPANTGTRVLLTARERADAYLAGADACGLIVFPWRGLDGRLVAFQIGRIVDGQDDSAAALARFQQHAAFGFSKGLPDGAVAEAICARWGLDPADPALCAEVQARIDARLSSTAGVDDAELLVLGKRLEAAARDLAEADAACIASFSEAGEERPDLQVAWDGAYERCSAIQEEIAAQPASTLPGLLAKLQALISIHREPGDFDEGHFAGGTCTDMRLVGGILRGLERLGQTRPIIPQAVPAPAAGDERLLKLGVLLNGIDDVVRQADAEFEANASDAAFATVDRAMGVADNILADILATPAVTIAGLHVKAKAVKFCVRDEDDIGDMFDHQTTDLRLVVSILRDLLAPSDDLSTAATAPLPARAA